MKRPARHLGVALVVLLSLLFSTPASAGGSGLIIREIKITGDEFVVLQNAGPDIDHLSGYWLGYVGDDSATPPPVQQLPDRALAAGAAILLSGGTTDTCDASIVTDLSPSLSDTKGSLALWHETGSGFEYLPDDQAKVSWGKSTATTVVKTGEIDLKDQTSQYNSPVWYFDNTSGWSLVDFSDCSLISYATNPTGAVVADWPANDSSPPAVIVSLADDQTGPAGIPAADQGLKPPQITELLPNPSGTGNDSTDEFIELYNPNNTNFDLSGFVLESGLSTKHKYTFPAGSLLPAKGFAAYYSEDTGLSLSNSGSQAALIDPLGNTISSSDSYTSAKDGLAWALADGRWLWTSQATPGKSNIVAQESGSSTKPGTTSKTGAVQAASTQSGSNSGPLPGQTAAPAPIHAWTLAGVGGAALIYASYEYRTELANNIYRVRRYIAARRTAGK